MTKPPLTEKVIQTHILSYLRGEGYFVWRENSGVMFQRGHQYRMGYPGIPDICGMTKDGRWMGIEVKAGTKQNEHQLEFERRAKESNGIYILAHSVEEVQDKLKLYEAKV